jgi:hypothetical protein
VNGPRGKFVLLFHVDLKSNRGLRGSKRITNKESRKKGIFQKAEKQKQSFPEFLLS